MSKTVDQRVVEMQFDNRHFEHNVSTTMSTLDKLKQKLNLTGASKGLENVGAAARKVDLSGISNGAETVGLKFNAMYTVADQALRNITNSAMEYGKRIMSALTIDPIKTGFSEYELKMDSVKTIMASTGESVEKVNSYLEELNEYSDQTIYSFSDMTQNIGKFTNAGVKLEDAVLAIKGISNEAAVSGANANEASRAMYNFAQALSAGYVKLIDWKSIENANMATVEFKQQLIDTAVELGTVTKSADGMYQTLEGHDFSATKNFNDVLQDQWMTTDVLVKTLGRYADKTTDIGKKAFAAAQEVTKFTQMWDVMKETAQSGWARTWEILIGDINQAKAVLTPLTNFFTGIIDNISDFRNAILESALGRGFSRLGDQISNIMKPVSKTIDTVKNATGAIDGITRSLDEHNAVVNEVIRGEWDHMKKRWDALTDAGYDWVYVQNKVNEELGSSVRRSSAYTEALKGQENAQSKTTNSTKEMSDADAKYIAQLTTMTNSQLKNLGYTDEQIAAFRELAKVAEQLGIPIEDFIKNMDEINGRWLIVNSFKNIGKALLQVFTAVGEAWKAIFPASVDVEAQGNKLFNIIAAFHKFTAGLKMSDETAEKLTRTFKGVFAILDIIATVAGGTFRIAFRTLTAILEVFDMDILDLTAMIGDAIVKFRDWVKITLDFTSVIEAIAPCIKAAVDGIRKWFEGIKDAENIPKYIMDGLIKGLGYASGLVGTLLWELAKKVYHSIDYILQSLGIDTSGFTSKIESVIASVEKWFAALKESDNIPRDILLGIINGLRSGASMVWNAVTAIGRGILDAVKEILGIHSPSTEFYDIAKNCILGFVNGLKDAVKPVWDFFSGLVKNISDFLLNIDFGTLLAGGLTGGIVASVWKVSSVIATVGAPLIGLGDMLEEVGDMCKHIGKGVKNYLNSKAVLTMAIAIGVLVASLIALSLVNPDRLWEYVGVIAALAGVVAALAGVARLLSAGGTVGEIAIPLLAIAGTMVLLAIVMKQLGGMDAIAARAAVDTLASIVIAIIALSASLGALNKGGLFKGISGVGSMLLQMSIAMVLMIKAVEMASNLDAGQVKRGIAVVAAIEVLFMAVIAVSKVAGAGASGAGGMLIKMSIAMLLMLGVVKLAAGFDKSEVTKGLGVIAGIEALFIAVIAVSKLAGKNASQAGSMLLKMSIALLLMTAVIRVAAGLSGEQLKKAVGVIAVIGTIFVALVAVSKLAGKHADQAGSMLVKISVALLILSGVMVILSLFQPAALVKALGAIVILSACVAGLIAVTHLAKSSKALNRTLIELMVAIGILAGIVIGLSFIDPVKVATGAAAMASLMGMFALMLGVTKLTKNTKGVYGTMWSMLGIVALLAGIVVGLSFINADNALKSCSALSLLMLAFSTALVIMSKAGRISTTVSKQMLPMVAVVAGLALVLALMSALNVDVSIESVAALSLLMLAMSGVMVILGTIGKTSKSALMGVLGLLAMAAPLAAFVGVLYLMKDVQNAMSNVLALTVLAAAMTALLIPLTVIGAFGTTGTPYLGALALLAMAVPLVAFVGVLALMQNVQNAMANVQALSALASVMTVLLIPLTIVGAFSAAALMGVLALTAMAVPLVALVGVLALMQNVDNAMENAKALSLLLATMAAVLVAVALVGPLAMTGVSALASLTIFMLAVGALATAVGALMEQFPQLESFLDTGIPILEKLAYGLGSIVGKLLAGFADGAMSSLPVLGTYLSNFMTNATPFINGAKSIDESVMNGVNTLVKAVLALTGANLLAGIESWLSSGSSFATLGTELSNFMTNAQGFITGASAIDPAIMQGVKTIADTVLILTSANILEGLTSWLTGGSSLENFSAQLPILGTGLAGFRDSLGSFTDENVKTVSCAATAIKTLASASAEIPNTGGLLGAIVGENDLGTFAAQFPILGVGLANFVRNVGTFTDEQLKTVSCAADAIKTLASASAEIPNAGGLLGAIVGDNDLGVFAAQFPILGTGLANFLKNVGTFTDDQVKTVSCAADAIKSLAQASSSIPNAGGLLAAIVGENDLGTFATQLPAVGTGIKGFVDKLGTFSDEQVGTVRAAVDAVNALSGLANADLKSAKKHLTDFGTDLPAFATNLSTFCTNMPSVSSITAASTGLNKILSAIESINNANSGCLATFASNLQTLGTDAVDKFVSAFTSSAAKTDLKNAGQELCQKVIEGIKSKQSNVKSNAKDTADEAIDGFEAKAGDAEDAGEDLGSGLVKGINSKQTAVYNAGYALGQKAVQGEKDGQQSKSPSKLTMLAGHWFGEGLIIGIQQMGNKVYKAGSGLGETATDSLSSTISRIADVINTDVDSQPTIRPVLDLSDVKSGANAIGNMLDMNSSVGVMANVGAINSMMNRRIQNGGNGDVVSAIDKLRKDLGNVGGTTYSIGGVTYNGESDVADAVRTIARAIKIEGRV